MALMITRRPGEAILIAGEVCVAYHELESAGEIRLAITAPDDLLVDRLEVAFDRDPGLRGIWGPDGFPIDAVRPPFRHPGRRRRLGGRPGSGWHPGWSGGADRGQG